MTATRPEIDWSAWLRDARRRLEATTLAPEVEVVGRVIDVGDGVATVIGLPRVALDEIVAFGPAGAAAERLGHVVALDEDSFSAVLLDDPETIEAGMAVRGTGRVIDVPVGEALLGRVVDPLGRPLDDRPPPASTARLPVERPAPAIIERDLVTEPVETGVLTVDALFALGRGQRELIIGDQATGKTALAIDTIINQRSSDLICIYVAVGQRTTAVAQAIAAVREHGAPERCIFVVASSAAPPGLQWLAPFAGMTMGEFFRDRGGHALVVIDDLTRHAATHRELALLTGEPPGREAYPGDIFYTHARLLERAAKLAPEKGGGSLTALPIAETEAGNLAAYIPTNLISITDGQLVMDSRLFAANQRPAINVGLSVSRVGGKTQNPALRQVAGRMRLDYAQFLELEMFTRFGSISDARIRARIERGQRIRALLSQPRYSPVPVPAQIALLAALGEGVLDGMPLELVGRLRERVRHALEAAASDAVATIRTGEGDRGAAIAHLVETVRQMAREIAAGTGNGGSGAEEFGRNRGETE